MSFNRHSYKFVLMYPHNHRFTYMDDSIPEAVKASINDLPASIKSSMLLVTDEQVHEKLHELIEEIESPVQIVFRDYKCQNCGTEGDSRLLEEYCHMEMVSHSY